MSYPQHPRPVVTKTDLWVAKLEERACQAAEQGNSDLLSLGRRDPNHLALRDCLYVLFGGWERGWRQASYAYELCEWELGRVNRRPTSASLGKGSHKERWIQECADEGFRILCHWLSLVDAMTAKGVADADGGQDALGSWPLAAIRAAAASPVTGRQVTLGGKDFNKRPAEETPELVPLFDDELAIRIQEACQSQRHRPIHDGRTVEDCLYFELPDVVSHLLDQPYAGLDYVIERLRWLVGLRTRRPQWGTRDDATRMRGLDDLALRLAQHWLSLHEALDGEVDLYQAADYLFNRQRRLLLTDVESLSDRVDFERVKEIRGEIRAYKPRERLSSLSA